MTERIYESSFHKRYVGGEGEVEDRGVSPEPGKNKLRPTTYEEVLAEYRWYVQDPTAELPDEVMQIFKSIQKTESEGEK